MTQNFVDRSRAIVNIEFLEEKSTVSLMGIKSPTKPLVVPASAFFSTKALSQGFGRIIKMGRTVVSVPFRKASTIAGKIKRAVIDKPIATIKGTIT
ncbi:MAG: hypothetical protein ACFE9L_03335 [Candidatus Hodarchaeota archaeon]